MQTQPGLTFSDTEQARNMIVAVAVQIVHQEEELFGSRQLQYRSFQISAEDGSANLANLGTWSALQRENRDIEYLAQLNEQRAVHFFCAGCNATAKCSSEYIGHQRLGCQFVTGHPKGNGINPMAMALERIASRCRGQRAVWRKVSHSSAGTCLHDVQN